MDDLYSLFANLSKTFANATGDDHESWDLSIAAAEATEKLKRGEITVEEERAAHHKAAKSHADAVVEDLGEEEYEDMSKGVANFLSSLSSIFSEARNKNRDTVVAASETVPEDSLENSSDEEETVDEDSALSSSDEVAETVPVSSVASDEEQN